MPLLKVAELGTRWPGGGSKSVALLEITDDWVVAACGCSLHTGVEDGLGRWVGIGGALPSGTLIKLLRFELGGSTFELHADLSASGEATLHEFLSATGLEQSVVTWRASVEREPSLSWIPPTHNIMMMPTTFILSRNDPQTISLEEWIDHITLSKTIWMVPPRTGVNSFTKKPQTFHPEAGAAILDSPLGPCSCSYKNGQIIIESPDSSVVPLIEEIARVLRATIQIAAEDA